MDVKEVFCNKVEVFGGFLGYMGIVRGFWSFVILGFRSGSKGVFRIYWCYVLGVYFVMF